MIVIKTLPGVPYYEGTKSLDGVPYRFRIKWATSSETWYMHMTSLVDSNVTLRGIALLPGKDLFARYGYSHLLGNLWVVDRSGANENPDYYEMGVRWELRYFPRG